MPENKKALKKNKAKTTFQVNNSNPSHTNDVQLPSTNSFALSAFVSSTDDIKDNSEAALSPIMNKWNNNNYNNGVCYDDTNTLVDKIGEANCFEEQVIR